MGDTIRVNLDVVNPIETTTGQRNLWPWNDAILHATTFFWSSISLVRNALQIKINNLQVDLPIFRFVLYIIPDVFVNISHKLFIFYTKKTITKSIIQFDFLNPPSFKKIFCSWDHIARNSYIINNQCTDNSTKKNLQMCIYSLLIMQNNSLF